MKKIFSSKPLVNKNNKQLSFTIPKKKFPMFKDKTPKLIKFRMENIEW